MENAPKKSRFEMDMCSGPLMGKLISFSVPLVLSSNLQLLFNAVDVIIVGKFDGSQSLAAVGSTTALINLIITMLIGISLGTNVMAGRYYASGESKKMEETVHTSMAFALISGIVIGIIGITCSGFALTWMATPENVFDDALLYIRIYFIGMPFFMLYNYGAAILRAVGDTKRPLIFLVIAGVTNAVLNMIMVICFHLGVIGVAVATVISQMISCVLVLRCLFKAEGSYKLCLKKLKIKATYVKQLFRIGLPAGIQSFVINFSNVLLQSSVNSFGDIAMAGYTAANSIFGFLFATVNSFTQTCMSFTSQNYGAKNFKRINRVLVDCMILTVSVSLVLGVGVNIFGEYILSIYSSDKEVIECGMRIFYYSTSTYFLCALMDLFPGSMRGVGYSAVPMILSVIGTVGVRIFWIYCVFPYHRSLDVLFISYPLSWLVTVVLQLVCFFFVRKKVKKELTD